VNLSGPSDGTVTVNYATADGSALAGSDYQANSGLLTFNPGQTSRTVTVLVNGDRVGEPNETFSINLSGPTNASIADGQGTGTVVDDEPRVSISDASVTEADAGTTVVSVTVSLSAASDAPVTVNFATQDYTAFAGQDYGAASGTLTFAPGETGKTVTVVVNSDLDFESGETFRVNLSQATNAAHRRRPGGRHHSGRPAAHHQHH
jgi:chitinase